MEFTTKQMMTGLSLDRITIYRWKNDESMPCQTENKKLVYTQKSLDWILTNKPKYKAQVEKMVFMFKHGLSDEDLFDNTSNDHL